MIETVKELVEKEEGYLVLLVKFPGHRENCFSNPMLGGLGQWLKKKKMYKLLWKRAVQTDLLLLLIHVADYNSDFPSIYLFTLLFLGPSCFSFHSTTFGQLKSDWKIKRTGVGVAVGEDLLPRQRSFMTGKGTSFLGRSKLEPSLIFYDPMSPCFVCHDTDSVSLLQ